jgi:predicted CxxxxCH...CXXCH cytochrome family protein
MLDRCQEWIGAYVASPRTRGLAQIMDACDTMPPRTSASALSAAFAIVLAMSAVACGEPRALTTGRLVGPCTECHGGGADQTGAPPFDLEGRSDPALPSVGAHTAHVNAGALAGAFDCGECHVKPTSVDSPGHIDGAVTITFGARATANGGVVPAYDAAGHGCATVYCHGAFPGGNRDNVPVWTGGAGEAACGTCHGAPGATPTSLPSGHARLAAGATNATCNVCHAATVRSDGTVDVGGGMHVNGAVDRDPAAVHPSGWLDPSSAQFHGEAASPSHDACLRCHAIALPAHVTTVVCAGCHDGTLAPTLTP